MRGQELLDCLGGIDARYIEDAAKTPRRRKPVWLRITAVAACVCLLVGGVWQGGRWYAFRSTMREGGAVTLPREGFSTSDAYGTLSELLTDLGDGEEHNTLKGDRGVEIEVTASQTAAATEGQHAVVYEHYAYHLADKQVKISSLSSGEAKAVGVIECDLSVVTRQEGEHVHGDFETLFVCGDQLIAVSTITVEGIKRMDRTYYTVVTTYTLSDPASPAVLHSWVQCGSLTHVYMAGDDLMLMTADGMCACGWSRLQDTDDYVPQLTADGEKVAWNEQELHILGAPRLVQYLAVTQIDTTTAAVKDKQAFYGWLTDVYYGADWFVLDVVADHYELYAFSVGDGIAYTGSFGMPDEAFASTSVFSVKKDGDIFRVIGEYRTGRGGNMMIQLLGMTVNMKKGTSCYTTFGPEDEHYLTIVGINWEEDRAVVMADLDIFADKSRFFFAEFHGMSVSLYVAPFEVNAISGDYWYWCEEKSLVPMGDGIYLRHGGSSGEYPNGMDIFDFSRRNAPEYIYAATDELLYARFGYWWTVYDPNTIGILVENADENGEYRLSTYSWVVYRICYDSETPFTRLASYELESERTRGLDSARFASFEYNGQHYITTRYMTVPLHVVW